MKQDKREAEREDEEEREEGDADGQEDLYEANLDFAENSHDFAIPGLDLRSMDVEDSPQDKLDCYFHADNGMVLTYRYIALKRSEQSQIIHTSNGTSFFKSPIPTNRNFIVARVPWIFHLW